MATGALPGSRTLWMLPALLNKCVFRHEVLDSYVGKLTAKDLHRYLDMTTNNSHRKKNIYKIDAINNQNILRCKEKC